MNQFVSTAEIGASEAHSQGSAADTHAARRLRGVAVVGLGYWGPNWVRNFYQLRCAERVIACDLDDGRCERIRGLYPGAETDLRFEDVLEDPDIEGVIIATPVSSHYPMARRVLESGKSVLVEKPLAMSPSDATELMQLAHRRGGVLMAGHTFEYSAPVLKIHEVISAGELGEVFYVSSIRANLGLFQHDVNVVWDLATHDISIILMIMGRMPEAVSCQGQSHYRRGIEDVALLALHFADNVIAFVHVSWLDPNKIRRTTIVGSRKMLVYDDTALQEKIRIYDKGVDVHRYYDTFGDFQFSYRYGDIQIPLIEEAEPLKAECEHFADCIRNGSSPRTDGLSGARVVSVLHAANLSLKDGGRKIPVETPWA
ncbi:MAG: Gfo/Idh/MocA family protein [Candidatus Binataceae bacterium]